MRNQSRPPALPLLPSLIATLALVWPLAASAHNWSYGFVWAQEPFAFSYTPGPLYAYSDVAKQPNVYRFGTGQYVVGFQGMSSLNALAGHVQVTAQGTGSDHCKIDVSFVDTVWVNCFDTAGNPIDTRFHALYLEADIETHADDTPLNVGNYAFALADQSTSPSYTPSRSSNPGGGAVTATRSSPGAYAITFAGMSAIGSGGGHVQVTAYGSGNASCRVENWSWPSGTISVRCYAASGVPIDSAYSVLYWRPGTADPGLAFAWADQPTSASYTPSPIYSYNAGGGAITALRHGPGFYEMRWEGMETVGVNGGHAQVTAYGGTEDARCKVYGWGFSGVAVRCFDAAGNPIDTRYTVLFLKTPKKPWAREYAFALAHEPAIALYQPYYIASYNAVGGYDYEADALDPRLDIEISRSATGRYNVHFQDFRAYAGGGNVQVVAAGPSSQYCKVASWGDEDVEIRCFDTSGSASDARFWILYLKSRSASAAYAWAGNSTVAFYTPHDYYAHNPAGGPITATRSSTGVYSMKWSGFGALGTGEGHVQVSAYGSDNRRCQVEGLVTDAVNVRCFDSTGNPADSAYSVLYVRPDAKDDGLAFAWADQPGVSGYTPNPDYLFNAGNAVTGWDFGIGEHQIEFGELDWRGLGSGVALVSGYGTSDNRCHYGTPAPASIIARCHDAAGSLVDARFEALLARPVAVPEPSYVALFSSGAALLALLARRRGPSYARVRHHANGTKNA